MPRPKRVKPSRIVPGNRSAAIRWYTAHIGRWARHATLLGFPAAQIDELKAAAAEARAADEDFERLRRATAAAATRATAKGSRLNRLGNAGINCIRGSASTHPRPGEVYAAAAIPPPRTPTPTRRPPTPTGLAASLSNAGVVELTWEGPTSRLVFEVERSVRLLGEGGGPYRPLSEHRVTRPAHDRSLPPGTLHALYRVRAWRMTLCSDWSEPGVLQLVCNDPAAEASPAADAPAAPAGRDAA